MKRNKKHYSASKKNEASFKWYSLKLIFIIIFIFFLQVFVEGLTKRFAFKPSLAFSEPWRFISATFLHSGLEHLFQNLFALFLFGIILEKIIGSYRFIALFIVGGFFGNLAALLFYPNALSLGASGAIMAVLGALTLLRPRMVVYFWGPIPLIALTIIWILIDAAGLFVQDNIGHAAHLAGFLAGIIYGLILRSKFSEEKEIKRKADKIISDEELAQWEDEWM